MCLNWLAHLHTCLELCVAAWDGLQGKRQVRQTVQRASPVTLELNATLGLQVNGGEAGAEKQGSFRH